ncbi:hypothetical protein PR048_017477 [Dryococelus australis]|uniref:Uncharacterized protein n=1 Tax=Dryococelus australis TaxID=614101 RepID=A0ABQ9H9P1_9NEOP|nr:hypothetical protein PR048_017477 [Dryococelus australis]
MDLPPEKDTWPKKTCPYAIGHWGLAFAHTEPIADMQGNKKRIPYLQMWGNTGATANEQTSEVRLYKGLWSLASSGTGMKGRGHGICPKKTRQPVASSGTIPTRENLGVTRSGIEPISPSWEASRQTAQTPWLLLDQSLLGSSRRLSAVNGPEIKSKVELRATWSAGRALSPHALLQHVEWLAVEIASCDCSRRRRRTEHLHVIAIRKVAAWAEGKIDFQSMYIEVTLVIGSDFVRHTLDDYAPIADLQGNKKRFSYCQMWGNTGCSLSVGIGKSCEFNDLYARLHNPLYSRNSDVCSFGCCPSVTPHLTVRDSLLVPLQVGYWRGVVQELMRVIEANMKQRRNERAGETGDP